MWSIAIRLWLFCTLLTGVVYPLTVMVLGHLFFWNQAEGEWVQAENRVVGLHNVGQVWKSPHYFWSRPSALQETGVFSGGSNQAWSNAALWKRVEQRQQEMIRIHGGEAKEVPNELLFTSASGLDPHLSFSAVFYQIPRILQARGKGEESKGQLQALINEVAAGEQSGFGDARYVNILLLNVALDKMWPITK